MKNVFKDSKSDPIYGFIHSHCTCIKHFYIKMIPKKCKFWNIPKLMKLK